MENNDRFAKRQYADVMPWGPEHGFMAPGTRSASAWQGSTFTSLVWEHLNDPSVPNEYKTRLQAALYRITMAQGDAQRREAEDLVNQIVSEITNKKETELAYQRSTPQQQYANMIAAGMSPSAAMAAISGGGEYSPTPTQPFAGGAPDSSEGLKAGVETAFTSLSTLFHIGAAAVQLGADLKLKMSEKALNDIGIETAQYALEGMQAAQEFGNVWQHATQTVDFDNSKQYNYDERIAKIRELAADGGTAYSDFVRDYIDTGRMDNPYAKREAISAVELAESNREFATRMHNLTLLGGFDVQQASQDLLNSEEENRLLKENVRNAHAEYENIKKTGTKLDAETALVRQQRNYYSALTGKTISDDTYQGLLNRAMACDVELREVTLDDLTDLQLLNLRDNLAVLQQLDPQGRRISLQTMLSNNETAYELAAVANSSAFAGREYWNKNPQLFDLASAYKLVAPGIESIATMSSAQSQNTTTTEKAFGIEFTRSNPTQLASYITLINSKSLGQPLISW